MSLSPAASIALSAILEVGSLVPFYMRMKFAHAMLAYIVLNAVAISLGAITDWSSLPSGGSLASLIVALLCDGGLWFLLCKHYGYSFLGGFGVFMVACIAMFAVGIPITMIETGDY